MDPHEVVLSGGVLRHESAQQLLTMLSGAAHKCVMAMWEAAGGEAQRFQQGLASIPNLSTVIMRQEVESVSGSFPAFPTTLKTVVMLSAREAHEADLATHRVHVKLPTQEEALHMFYCFMAQHPHVTGGGYTDTPFGLESRLVCSEALRYTLSNVLHGRVTLIPREMQAVEPSALTRGNLSRIMGGGEVRPSDSVSQTGSRKSSRSKSRAATRVSGTVLESSGPTTHVSVNIDGGSVHDSEGESAFTSALRSVSRAASSAHNKPNA